MADTNLDLSSLKNVFLLDGKNPTCLNYASTAATCLNKRFKIPSDCIKGIVWSEIGGVIGTIKTLAQSENGLRKVKNSLSKKTFYIEPKFDQNLRNLNNVEKSLFVNNDQTANFSKISLNFDYNDM